MACQLLERIKKWNGEIFSGRIYPDAAWSPKPREPPVTTTTFPFREKIFGKSCSSVSYLDIVGGSNLTQIWK
jgi:hypothetical protein